ncbi:hypothetical protein [uncultured Duncaniella sp.]|uniref:hypothetical protein n=1 Tax=uncultured Duncaniella sp. TaxID=2768039 RepID=UPI0025B73638|nr:hypothetical protein [uncultured Duncaniella sp.]
MERFVFDLNNRTSHHNPLKSKGFTSKRTDLIKQRFVLCPIKRNGVIGINREKSKVNL